MLPPSGTETPVLGLSISGISQGNLRSRGYESGSRPPIQDWSSPRRLEAPSRSGSPLMDPVRQGSDRPFHFIGDHSLQDVVLPGGSGRFTGFTRAVSRVAGKIVLRFSSTPIDSPSTQQDCPGPLQSAVNSPPLAKEALVSNSPSVGLRATMGPASQGCRRTTLLYCLIICTRYNC